MSCPRINPVDCFIRSVPDNRDEFNEQVFNKINYFIESIISSKIVDVIDDGSESRGVFLNKIKILEEVLKTNKTNFFSTFEKNEFLKKINTVKNIVLGDIPSLPSSQQRVPYNSSLVSSNYASPSQLSPDIGEVKRGWFGRIFHGFMHILHRARDYIASFFRS